jgi:hypothetical protein
MRGRKSKPESQVEREIVFEEKQPGALGALAETIADEVPAQPTAGKGEKHSKRISEEAEFVWQAPPPVILDTGFGHLKEQLVLLSSNTTKETAEASSEKRKPEAPLEFLGRIEREASEVWSRFTGSTPEEAKRNAAEDRGCALEDVWPTIFHLSLRGIGERDPIGIAAFWAGQLISHAEMLRAALKSGDAVDAARLGVSVGAFLEAMRMAPFGKEAAHGRNATSMLVAAREQAVKKQAKGRMESAGELAQAISQKVRAGMPVVKAKERLAGMQKTSRRRIDRILSTAGIRITKNGEILPQKLASE